MADIKQSKEQRRKLIEDNRLILDKADAEMRAMTTGEVEQYDKRDSDISALSATIDRHERQAAHVVEAEERQESETRAVAPASQAGTGDSGGEVRHGTASLEYRAAYDNWFRRGDFERRAMQVGTDSEGGFLVPDEWGSQLIEARVAANVMRQLATVIQTKSGTFTVPSETSDGTAAWTAEEAAFNDSQAVLAELTFSAHKWTRLVKVSDELLADNAYNAAGYVTNRIGRAGGILEESAFVNGDGSSKPTGIVGGSTLGVTAAGTAAITTDEVIDLYHSLARQYRVGATFMAADATIKLIRKLKDTTNQYLWQPGMMAGEPDRLQGRPLVASEDMPAPTTGLKSVIFGDFSYYWIADRAGFTFKRLDELYAANGQVGFVGLARTDGKLTLATAVNHLIQA